VSDAPPKTAAGMIVDAALKVIPKEDRELAGQAAGAIVRDVFGSVAQVTTLLRYVVQFPGTAGRGLGRPHLSRRSADPGSSASSWRKQL